MRLPGAAAVAVAAIVTSIVAVPAGAATPGPVVSGSGNCLGGGRAAVSLRVEQATEDTTNVVIVGKRVADGRWRGVYSPDTTGAGADRDIEVGTTAAGGTFRLELDADSVDGDQPGVYLQHKRQICVITLYGGDRLAAVGTGDSSLAIRTSASGEIAAGAFIGGCRNGSRWQWLLDASFDQSGSASGGDGLACRHRVLRIPRTVVSSGHDDGALVSVDLFARSPHGVVRRISYWVG